MAHLRCLSLGRLGSAVTCPRPLVSARRFSSPPPPQLQPAGGLSPSWLVCLRPSAGRPAPSSLPFSRPPSPLLPCLAPDAGYFPSPEQWCPAPAAGTHPPSPGFLFACLLLLSRAVVVSLGSRAVSSLPASTPLGMGHPFWSRLPCGFRDGGECGPGHGRRPLYPSSHSVQPPRVKPQLYRHIREANTPRDPAAASPRPLWWRT